MMMGENKKVKGFIALITVLIILAITLAVGISLSLGSISETRTGLQKTQSSTAYYLANLCTEEALMKLKENSNYAGNEIINMENGSCEILPIEGNWIIKVLANSSGQVRKMKIVISQINPEMIINSWEEVAEF
jgi:type II secretory pathway component PulK